MIPYADGVLHLQDGRLCGPGARHGLQAGGQLW
jgi:hypothetical protein